MCLHKLIIIHRCVFKILEKTKWTDIRTDGRTDGRDNSIPHHKRSLRGRGKGRGINIFCAPTIDRSHEDFQLSDSRMAKIHADLFTKKGKKMFCLIKQSFL